MPGSGERAVDAAMQEQRIRYDERTKIAARVRATCVDVPSWKMGRRTTKIVRNILTHLADQIEDNKVD